MPVSNHYLRGQNRIWPLKLLNFGFDSIEAHLGAPTVGAKILRCSNPGYQSAAAKKRTRYRGVYVFGRARPAQLIRGALPLRAKDASRLNRSGLNLHVLRM